MQNKIPCSSGGAHPCFRDTILGLALALPSANPTVMSGIFLEEYSKLAVVLVYLSIYR